MGDIVESKIGETIKDLLHANLGKLAVWQGIQNELDLLISDIPTFANENNKNKLVNSLKVVMTFLKEHGISEEHLEFLQEEIDRYNNITQISIYEEKDDQLSPEIIEKYAQLGFGQEGIIGLNEPFTFPQLNRLVNGVYEQTKLVKFYISAEKTVRGKIVAEIFEQAQKIPIAMLVKSNKTKEENEDTPAYTKIYLFGSRHDNRKETILKEIEIPLYIYRFTTDSNQDLILLSAHKLEIGEFIVTGVETQCTDNKNLTSTSKLTTKLPFLFVHHAVNRIIHFKGPDDFKNFRENLPGSNEEFFDYPFTTTLRHEKTGSIKQCILNHPTWYKWLVWSWLLHEKKGLFNKYPLHLFQLAAAHCLPKGTLIRTPRGLEKIENTKEVNCLNHEGKITSSKAVSFCAGLKEITKIHLGKEVMECSNEHKWFVLRNNKIKLVKTKNLTKKDKLLRLKNGNEMHNLWKNIPTESISCETRHKKMFKCVQNKEKTQILRNMWNEIFSICRKKILFDGLLPKSTKEKRKSDIIMERNRHQQSNRIISKRILGGSSWKRTQSPPYIYEKKINECRNQNKAIFVSTRIRLDTLQKKLRKLHNGRQEESIIQAWKVYWKQEEPKILSFFSKNESKLGMSNVRSNKKQKQNEFSCASHQQEQQRQQIGKHDGSVLIVPCEITLLEKTNKKIEMWDIQVPNYHNFILANGVITHNSGKSLMLNALHTKTSEHKQVFSGSSSRLLYLVPSFKYNPPQIGYLAESNRFAFCDEFLRCLTSTVQMEDSKIDERLAMLNDLLEHQKREAGSGVSRLSVNMTSRVFAASNPIKGMKTCADLLGVVDNSFLSRWLIYFQSPQHIDMIRQSKDEKLRTNDFSLVKEDFLSIIDFLQSFSSAYDLDKVEKFKHDFDDVMSEELKNHYDSRHMHHIECLIDGIVKARCLVEKDYSFVAKKEDYDVLESVWTEIVRSWINPEAIKNAPASKRINYLPANCKIVHNLIKEAGGSIHNAELKEASRKFMHQNEFYAAFVVLADNNIIIEEGSFIKVCV